MVVKAKRCCARCTKQLSPSRQKLKYCYRCDAAVKKEQAEKSHRTRVAAVYGIVLGFYDALLRYQLGRCAICRRATGLKRRLAVDHDHACCPTLPACGECVRGLLCKPCNRMLGHGRDDPEFFDRAADYLRNPPAKKVLAK